ncbi:MAG: succinate dehydrogenase [Myxococcales bacterium]|nr:succinate dehydrogenase [Myxococcales bacterium]
MVDVPVKRLRFGQTQRRDAWWVTPAISFLILGSFVVYATWAAFQGDHYFVGNYLSPFYSPELWGGSPHALFGTKPSFIPEWVPFSPALLILWAPGGFRFTCYYYRGNYYKSMWADPPACAVGEPRKHYLGEKVFPLIIQNLHRYFLYFAVFFLFFLAHDAWKSFWFNDSFGVGVGSLIITANVILLGGYTFSCHSMRHLVGGFLDRFSAKPARSSCYDCVSSLNRHHHLWAWCSLFCVAGCDVYIRLLSKGVICDWRIF